MPPKKRQRKAAPSDDAKPVVVRAQPVVAQPPLARIDAAVEDIIGHLESPTKMDAKQMETLKEGLLALKGIQNELFADLRQSSEATQQRQAALAQRERQLAALRYEQGQLEVEIEGCQNFSTPYLRKMAQDEGVESLEDFLKADVLDPAQRQKIITKLQMEINARGGLDRDFKAKQTKLVALQEEVKKKQSFLQSLPGHVTAMERASMPLQRTMYGSDSKTPGLRMNGTERRARLEAAQGLPLSLFTLFSSLQQYIDQAACTEEVQTLLLSVSSEKQEVLLQLPLGETTSSTSARPKRVVVHFQLAEEGNLVTASLSGGSTSLFQEVALEDLFPGEVLSKGAEGSSSGRAYGWCNYLAGLHHVQKEVTQSSVRAVVRMLSRRIRANATLKTILHSLMRHQIPALPAETGVEGMSVEHTCKLLQLVSKLEKDERFNTDLLYKVVLRKGSEQLEMQVAVHKSRYPEVPPVWTLNVAPDGQTPLYDERLADLERKVNTELLERMETASEATHEWILIHQLHTIMQAWDGW